MQDSSKEEESSSWQSVVRVSEIINELDTKFIDGETIEDKAFKALDEIPRSVAIGIIDRIEEASQFFSNVMKTFMEGKPCDYIITEEDMQQMICDFKGKGPPL